MNLGNIFGGTRERATAYWIARSEQERRYLGVGFGVVLLALVYMGLIEPAVEGRAQLQRSLPELRQQAAQLAGMAQVARGLAGQQPVPVTPMTEASLKASLGARSITPASLTLTGEYARLQVNGVSFANLVAWLDAQRRENRIAVRKAPSAPRIRSAMSTPT
ncbi:MULTISPECIES: type II secretion system protein GspM [unclassified Massilia]|uniref:type II secretion system protein GspM n=1 Tax=unclassified Massilia TaxID=2609279 RepID=UPI001E3E1770|nr:MULTISPECIES: type II secretion system protein GspM [unclassified Massilia]